MTSARLCCGHFLLQRDQNRMGAGSHRSHYIKGYISPHYLLRLRQGLWLRKPSLRTHFDNHSQFCLILALSVRIMSSIKELLSCGQVKYLTFHLLPSLTNCCVLVKRCAPYLFETESAGHLQCVSKIMETNG